MPVSLPEQELRAWLRLSMEPGLSLPTARSLLAAIGLPHDIYASAGAALSRLVPAQMAAQLKREPSDEAVQAIERTLAWLEQPGHHLLTLADAAFPPSLFEIHDPPLLLYANGNPGLLMRPSLAVVGARSATPAGMDNARAFSRHLSSQGWCIVSGLAQGIDAAAHEGAMQAGPQGGGTVAVLGTGIDIVFPAVNRGLAHQVAETGVLITEFPMGARGLKHHFPQRNRIVAGLARGVLVVEAARQSGSLITARLASEAGREVFAIPGSIHSPLSRGCHALIRQGARLVESGQDILEELGAPQGRLPGLAVGVGSGAGSSRRASRQGGWPGWDGEVAGGRKPRFAGSGSPGESDGPGSAEGAGETSGARSAAYVPQGKEIDVLAALGHDPVHMDALITRTGLDITALNRVLLELEMAGVIARQGDGRYQRLAMG